MAHSANTLCAVLRNTQRAAHRNMLLGGARCGCARVKTMAKRNKHSSTVVVGAQAQEAAQVVVQTGTNAETGAPVVVVQEAQAQPPVETGATRKEKRAAKQLRGADGKPVHGLTSVQSALDAGYTYGAHMLVRAQFRTAALWFGFCAWRAEQEAQEYHAKAADASANPEAYKRAQSGGAKLAQENKELAATVARLEAMLAQVLAAQNAQ